MGLCRGDLSDKDGAFMSYWLCKRGEESSLAPFHLVRTQEEDVNHEPDVELFPDKEPAGTFDIDLSWLQNCEKLIYIFYQLPTLWFLL